MIECAKCGQGHPDSAVYEKMPCARCGALLTAFVKATRLYSLIVEVELRRCLSHWVSELEPTMLYRNGAFLGLGIEGDPSGTVMVRAWPPGGITIIESNPSREGGWVRRLFDRCG